MKKILLFILISTLVVGLYGQWSYFVTNAGLSISGVMGDDWKRETEMINGGIFGISTIDMENSKLFAIEPGIRFILNGFQEAEVDSLPKPKSYVNFYVEANARLKTNVIMQQGGIGLYPYIGVGLSILLISALDDASKMDVPIIAGMEFVIKERATFGIEWNMGLVPLVKETDLRNTSLIISLGYVF
jgi:hypothetical protein